MRVPVGTFVPQTHHQRRHHERGARFISSSLLSVQDNIMSVKADTNKQHIHTQATYHEVLLQVALPGIRAHLARRWRKYHFPWLADGACHLCSTVVKGFLFHFPPLSF